jgi:hypothetical protein
MYHQQVHHKVIQVVQQEALLNQGEEEVEQVEQEELLMDQVVMEVVDQRLLFQDRRLLMLEVEEDHHMLHLYPHHNLQEDLEEVEEVEDKILHNLDKPILEEVEVQVEKVLLQAEEDLV